MAPHREWPRLSFQEALELSRLPDQPSDSGATVQRFMSRRPAWVPTDELPWRETGLESYKPQINAFGGFVYALAPLAAARSVEKEDEESGNDGETRKRGIHSIQAVFTNPGLADRPFVLDVLTVQSGRSFSTHIINARQPTGPSSVPSGPFPLSDAEAPLGKNRFTCITTFKRPAPNFADVQQPPPQERFKDILSLRAPTEWDRAPQADIDVFNAMFPDPGPGALPVIDMYKVDMTQYNEGKPIPERRELILYRLLKPLPREDVNAHVLCHAFEADRNGMVMLANHLGWGFRLLSVGSLSYSFYVHVNASEAVMEGDGFWIQEVCWPRVSAGRGKFDTQVWSPDGRHVASGHQDGYLAPVGDKDHFKAWNLKL